MQPMILKCKAHFWILSYFKHIREVYCLKNSCGESFYLVELYEIADISAFLFMERAISCDSV